MKKFLSIFLAILLLLSFSACKNDNDDGKIKNPEITCVTNEFVVFIDDGQKILDVNNLFNATEGLFLSYSSSDNSIVSVGGNVVTAKSKGQAVLTAKNDEYNVSSSLNIIVYDKAIILEKSEYTIDFVENQLATVDLNIITKYSELEYVSTNNDVVVVENRKLVAKGLGLATVTIKDKNGIDSVSVLVEVRGTGVNTIQINSIENNYVNFFGRNRYIQNKGVQFEYTVSGFEFTFYGTSAYAELSAVSTNEYKPRFQVLVDGEKVDRAEDDNNVDNVEKQQTTNGQKILNVNSLENTNYELVSGLELGWHTVKVLKRTPAKRGDTIMDKAILHSISVDDGGYIGVAPKKSDIKIEVYGDSISCAYGNLVNGERMHNNNTNGLLGYHYLAAEKLGAQINVQAHSGWGIIYDTESKNNLLWPSVYGKFSDGQTDYDFNYDANVIVINLGTNDASGANKTAFESNFCDAVVNWVKDICMHNPDAKIILSYGMMGQNAKVINGYNQAVTILDDEGYDIYFLLYDTQTNGSGHPSKADHIANSEKLYNKIVDVLNDVSENETICEVKFVQDGRTDTVTVKKGEAILLENIPELIDIPGYELSWVKTDFSYIRKSMVVNVIKTPKKFTITYDLDLKAYPDATIKTNKQQVVYGEDFTFLVPSSSNGTFIKWVDENGTEFKSGKYTLTRNITLKAVWNRTSIGPF